MSDVADMRSSVPESGAELDDARSCWRVAGESLDVFAAPVNATGEQVETGRYLFTQEPGRIGFGVAPVALADGTRLAVRGKGAPGSVVTALPRSALDATSLVAGIAEVVDDWLLRLAHCVPSDDVAELIAEPDRRQEAAAGSRIGAPRDRVVWIEVTQGALRFSKQGPAAPAEELPVVIAGTQFVTAEKATAFAAWTTATLLERNRGRFWQAFDRAQERLFAAVAADFATQRARERDRISDRMRQSALAFADGLQRAGSVLRDDARAGETVAGDDPLFAAASLVAARQKIVLKRARHGENDDVCNRLEAICRASRIELREVALEHDWYRQDHGPMVGFLEDAGQPVALLPCGTAGYEEVNPTTGQGRRVNASVASRVRAKGYVFYSRIETAPVTAGQLARFGLAGTSADMARMLGMGLLGGLFSLVLPAISDPLFTDILPRAEVDALGTVVLAMAMSTLGSSSFNLVRSFSLLRIEGRMEASIQAALWERLLHLAPNFFRNYTTGDLADRLMSVTTIRSVITSAISGSVLDAMVSVLSFALMYWYSWRLALVATGLALIAVLLTAVLTGLQIPHQRALMLDMGKVGGLTYQLLTAIGKLRVAGAEARAFGRWAGILAGQKQHAYRARRIAALQQALTQAFPPLTSVALYVAMIKLGEPVAAGGDATQSLLSLGGFVAFNAAFGQFVTALMSAVSGLTTLVTVVPLYERVQPVLDTLPETRRDAVLPGMLTGEIEFRNVTFQYQENLPLVLDNVSFRVEPGDYVAIVGPSGGGKSTMVRLALGFETPQSGSVLFDQKEVMTLDLSALRRQIGVVLQNAGLVAGSLYENIVGSQPIPLEEAWEAARLAGLEADIRSMPMGMQTHISDSAPMLSGGQRQRLTIARALVRKPRILIFDEATSALDNHTQSIVNQTLAGLNLTRIVIAHRLSTVRHVDRILVLKQGRIVESGSYDELLARGGVFSELVKQQLL